MQTDSAHEVNMEGALKVELERSIENAEKQPMGWNEVQRDLFLPTQAVVLDLLSNASLTPFFSTKEFKKFNCGMCNIEFIELIYQAPNQQYCLL